MGTIECLDFIGVQTGLKMPLGMPTLGGSLVTGSGLVFFGSAMDHYLRVIDVETGDESAALPMQVGANATPMSYAGPDGKQYIVISAGGATYAAKEYRGDNVIAYALP